MSEPVNEHGILHDLPADPARRLAIFNMEQEGPQFYLEGQGEGFSWAWRGTETSLYEAALERFPYGRYCATAFHKRCIFERGKLVIEWPELTAAECRFLVQVLPEALQPSSAGSDWYWPLVEPEPEPVTKRRPLRYCGAADTYVDAKSKAEKTSREEDTLIMVVRRVAVMSMY
ncbi:hypothetical protein LZC95_02320 [Pendulispora brunnea]|uniref:Uncharacterized protein n=1 Tax=Pendulispora brunnea TaxID=2905690 RepID=A0ABZ2KDV1_9BACT